jgi:hypothetical protein
MCPKQAGGTGNRPPPRRKYRLDEIGEDTLSAVSVAAETLRVWKNGDPFDCNDRAG